MFLLTRVPFGVPIFDPQPYEQRTWPSLPACNKTGEGNKQLQTYRVKFQVRQTCAVLPLLLSELCKPIGECWQVMVSWRPNINGCYKPAMERPETKSRGVGAKTEVPPAPYNMKQTCTECPQIYFGTRYTLTGLGGPAAKQCEMRTTA